MYYEPMPFAGIKILPEHGAAGFHGLVGTRRHDRPNTSHCSRRLAGLFPRKNQAPVGSCKNARLAHALLADVRVHEHQALWLCFDFYTSVNGSVVTAVASELGAPKVCKMLV